MAQPACVICCQGTNKQDVPACVLLLGGTEAGTRPHIVAPSWYGHSFPTPEVHPVVQGYFHALSARFRHFKGKPQQQAKLVELVLAALQQRVPAPHEASPAPSSLPTAPNTGCQPSPAPMST